MTHPVTPLSEQVQACRLAARTVANLSTAAKNEVLLAMANQLLADEDAIIGAGPFR